MRDLSTAISPKLKPFQKNDMFLRGTSKIFKSHQVKSFKKTRSLFLQGSTTFACVLYNKLAD